jgi:ubiquinone/menaquinone biosynthesis C-methylase UbiE
VNRRFVDDVLAAGGGEIQGDILDLGTGTARIPIELCRRAKDCRIMAADAATNMLDLARLNVEIAGLMFRIQLAHVDAKKMPFADGMFDIVISNSILHHIPEPIAALREAVRVLRPGGLLFFRDLLRPKSKVELDQLVQTYAGTEGDHARAMFAASLHAALALVEVRELATQVGFPPESVTQTSDRHWTMSGPKPVG